MRSGYAGLMMAWGLAAAAVASAEQILPADFDVGAKGVLLQVTEAVPVFSRPDPQSPQLAKADVGTVLLLIDFSKKRTWAQIEDDQGTRGWVPVDRTDLSELLAAQIKLRDAQIAETQNQLDHREADETEEVEAAQFQSTNNISHTLGPLYRYTGASSLGALYSLMFEFQTAERGGVRQRAFGAEVAWLRHSAANLYEFRLRYASKFSARPRLSYGPDVAVSLGTVARPTVGWLGYRMGYEVFWYLPLELRGAVGTEAGRRWMGELSWRMKF